MRTIPPQMLIHTVTVSVPAAVNSRQSVTSTTEYTVKRCCLQRTSTTAKTSSNTSQTNGALLLIDARLSSPRLDWFALKHQADCAGGDIIISCDGYTYTATDVAEYMDNHGKTHHYEVTLV